MLKQLKATGRRFTFKQGLDERILTDKKCELLFSSKLDGDITFAFDNIADKDLIERKLNLINKYTNKQTRFYVLCGFDRNEKYDQEFWIQDLYDTFERVMILMKHNAIPYIMRFNKYVESPYAGTYKNLAAWCNQVSLFKKKTYREFCYVRATAKNKVADCVQYMLKVENEIPDLAQKYYDIRWEDVNECCVKRN